MRRRSPMQLAGLRQARQRAEAAEAALRDAVQRATRRPRPARRTAAGPIRPPMPRRARRSAGSRASSERALERGAAAGAARGAPDGGRAGGQPGGAAHRAVRRAAVAAGGRGGDGSRDGRQDGGYGAYGTPEGHEFSRSAPGTEAFKQDYARWESLSKNVKDALEDLESSLANRLSDQRARDRVTAGEDDRAPALYEDAVSRYYRSIARGRPRILMDDVT